MVEKLRSDYELEVEWRPFYLYWDTPPEGRDLPEHVKQRRAAGSEERLRQLAASLGMQFVSTRRIYSTRRAHEATEYARDHGRHMEFHGIVFRKIYAEGLDISQWDVLRAAAQEADLDGDEMQRDVDAGKFTRRVEQQVEQAYRMGVSGVPTYVINNRYAIVGAQPYEVFRKALEQVLVRPGGRSHASDADAANEQR